MEKGSHSKLIATIPWPFRSPRRLFLTLFLVIAVPTAILTILTGSFVTAQLKREAIRENELTARLVAKQLQEEFFGLRRYVESFATRVFVIEKFLRRDFEVLRDQLEQLTEQNEKVSRAFITNPDGTLLLDHPHDPEMIGRNFAHRGWYTGAATSKWSYVSEAYKRSALDQAMVITVAMRVADFEGNLLGFLGIQYEIEDLMEWLESIQPSHLARVAIFDQNQKQILRINAPNKVQISGHPAVQQVLNKPPGSRKVSNLDGFGRTFLSHFPVVDLGWTVVSYADDKVIFAPAKQLLRMLFIFFLIALAAMALLGWNWYRVLYAYSEDLRKSNKELERFCYSIAHDLRAPLRSLSGFSNALIEDYGQSLDEKGREYAKRIGGSATRMDDLIQSLLEYGAIAHGGLNFEQINLNEVVSRSITSLNAELKASQSEVKVQQELGTVSADREMMQHVMQQLLCNAIKFVTPDTTPRIEILAEDRGARKRLYVKDNGIGIDPQHQQKIFGVFERLHGYDLYSGTGIGLSIVKKAVERMGGSVGVDSEPGNGSAFWIELPCTN